MPCGSIKTQQKLDTKASQFDPVFGPIHFGLEANAKYVTFSMKSLQGRKKFKSLKGFYSTDFRQVDQADLPKPGFFA